MQTYNYIRKTNEYSSNISLAHNLCTVFEGLEQALSHRLHGQPLVRDTLINALKVRTQ